VVGVGTGGTISGVGSYLKMKAREAGTDVKIWGIDTYGSVFKKYHETGVFDENEIYSYVTEGIGEDILPLNVRFEVIDGFTKVTDKDAAIWTQKLSKTEGMFLGNSAGAAMKGLHQLKEHFNEDDVIVVLFHDHGSRYVGKMYNDEWMKSMGYVEDEMTIAADLIKNHNDKPLITVKTEEIVLHAIERMKKYEISQVPVEDITGIVGALDETDLLRKYMENKDIALLPIKEVMNKPFPIVQKNAGIEEISKLISKDQNAVLVDLEDGTYHIITKHDIIGAL
jgi:cystathionine beta-synthase